jgi:hypothetical protein
MSKKRVSEEERKQRQRDYVRKIRGNGYYNIDRSIAGLTECKCPKCGKKHKRLVNWSGKLPAKLYCDFCRPVVEFNSIGTELYICDIGG